MVFRGAVALIELRNYDGGLEFGCRGRVREEKIYTLIYTLISSIFGSGD